MDKQKLEAEKMALVWQFNALQEKIESYWIDIIATNCQAFKDEINLRDRIQQKIKEVNEKIENLEKTTLSI